MPDNCTANSNALVLTYTKRLELSTFLCRFTKILLPISINNSNQNQRLAAAHTSLSSVNGGVAIKIGDYTSKSFT